MAKPFSFVTSVIVAAALAVPSLAATQDNRRSGGGSEESSSRTGSGSGDVAVARSSAPEPSAPSSSPSSESRPSAIGSDPRPQSETPGGGSAQAMGRTRGTQPAVGSAEARPFPNGRGGGSAYVTVLPSWSSLYGGYYGGYYNNYYGYASAPWGYYGGLGYWNRYGIYDPFLYDPFSYYGGFYGSPFAWSSAVVYGGGSYSENREDRGSRDLNGSIRLKVNPKTAKVYIDGALAGTADEFDGLGGHLEIAAGPHQLELRAEGFTPFTTQITVKANRTQTERVSLKKP